MIKTITIHSRSSYWTSRDYNEEVIVDSEDLAIEIQNQCNKLVKEGFNIVSIIPINSGNINHGSGVYFTESVIITATKHV